MARKDKQPGSVMPLGEHLEELRKRIMLALLGIVPIFAVGLIYSKTILAYLVEPLRRALGGEDPAGNLQVTSLFEGFNTWVKVGFIVALTFGAPWILYQFWKFVAPGLYLRERRFVNVLAPLSAVLALTGLAFMYFVVLRFALAFFVHFNKTLLTRPAPPRAELPAGVALSKVPVLPTDPVDPVAGTMWINSVTKQLRVAIETGVAGAPPEIWNMPLIGDSLISQHYKVSEYLGMILTFGVCFALAFQTPVVVLLLGWADIVKPDVMRKYRRHVFLGCTIVGALVAPPDAISMIALMIPLYLLFELGLLLLRIMPAERVASGTIGRGGSLATAGAPADAGDDDPYSRPDDR